MISPGAGVATYRRRELFEESLKLHMLDRTLLAPTLPRNSLPSLLTPQHFSATAINSSGED